MKKHFLFIALGSVLQLSAQNVSDGRYALPERLQSLPAGNHIGFPQNIESATLREEFKSPPRGYGNVPFYWWNGGKLSKDKLKYELDILKQSPLDGFAVSYVHTHAKADKNTEYKGSGLFGATEHGSPALMSDEWYDYWKWFSALCAKDSIGVGLDDYTFAWTGNGYYPDEVRDLNRMKEYQGTLDIKKTVVKEGDTYRLPQSGTRISCYAWSDKNPETAVLISSDWKASEGDWIVYDVSTKPNYMLEPTHGKEITERYFQRVENKLTTEDKKGTNFYFQDELSIPLNFLTWSEDFPEIFMKMKGYDIKPFLGALSGGNVGKLTEKARLDYADVLMTLAEDRYFKPIFDWHWNRGLIYGCDNLSRGRNPIEYVDYFRATRWFTAPGNDAPARGSSLMSCKVSSSISHLYQRPRTWLEAFHSMGWGSSGEWLTSQLDHHLIGGGNLLCLHGLYYSTRGSWWEWAPPDFHYRMPYWEHMKLWLQYAQRMSYVLSQGTHVCDIALLYPTEAMQGVDGKSGEMAFNIGQDLIDSGLDFDYIDYQSVERSELKDKQLSVGNENYKIFILADMPALHHSTLTKALRFYREGGIVIALGELPYASTLNGRSDDVDEIVKEMFGVTALQLKSGESPLSRQNAAGGKTFYATSDNLSKIIRQNIIPDFAAGGEAKVLHRRIDKTDLYMVMNVEDGKEMFFRSKGKVELWNANTGEITEIPVIRQDEIGTTLSFNNVSDRSYLVVFNSDEKPSFVESHPHTSGVKAITNTIQIPIEDEWETEIIPTMDNRFGDFRLPIREKMIGAEARTFRIHTDPAKRSSDWYKTDFPVELTDTLIYGYGSQAKMAFNDSLSFEYFVNRVKLNQERWEPYRFSWQYGVWEEPGNQGYHGLKGRVDDRFIIMGDSGNYAFFTNLYAPHATTYSIITDGKTPEQILIDSKNVSNKIKLTKGWHKMLLFYKNSEKGQSVATHEMYDERTRSAVVLIPENESVPKPYTRYDDRLAMRWEECSERVRFSPFAEECLEFPVKFNSAPGMNGMEISAFANSIKLWIDGKEIPASAIKLSAKDKKTGLKTFCVKLNELIPHSAEVSLLLTAIPGYADASILPYPIRMECGKGLMKACNWANVGELIHYSGGMKYNKNITLPSVKEKRVMLDLGEVVATCEVHINGKKAGTLLNSPYLLDITDFVMEGNNKIDVLVYSTLSNHYQTVPTPKNYRGDARAGLIGPVKIVMEESAVNYSSF